MKRNIKIIKIIIKVDHFIVEKKEGK